VNHFSIDCETLGVSTNNPAILSIGVVRFDPETGKLGGQQYFEIDIDDTIRHGHIDGSTLRWWVTQSPVARDVFSDKPSKVKLREALDVIGTTIRSADVPTVWFKGPCEDGAWLKSAYRSVGLAEPWHFTKTRDVRTLIELAEMTGREVKDVGTAHNALDDAKFQALIVSYGMQKIAAAMKGFRGKDFVAKFNVPKDEPVTVDDDDEL
jgi:hypothetical protein